MASSARFFSRKRLARSKCLLTSAAIRLKYPCRLAVCLNLPRPRTKRGARGHFPLYPAKEGRAKPAFKRLAVNAKWPEQQFYLAIAIERRSSDPRNLALCERK